MESKYVEEDISENPGSSSDHGSNLEDFEDQTSTHTPFDGIEPVRGYELVSFDAMNVPPPVIQVDEIPSEVDGQHAISIVENDARITEELAQIALLAHLKQHCCYGQAAAKHMKVKRLDYIPAYHYELQTFTEKRETAWTFSAIKPNVYEEQSSLGFPPLPWDIDAVPSQPFKDEVRLIPIPNTSAIKACHRCRGTGGVTCRDCAGKGWYRCIHCHGDGWIADSGGHRERCFYCHHSKQGHGHQDCGKCNTKGKVNCATCEGQGQIRCFIQLSITWKVHTAEHIVDHLSLPQDLIRDVSGQVAFEEESAVLKPIRSSSNEDISKASSLIVTNHWNSLAVDQKVIKQRHQIRIVPLTKVVYEWKQREHHFVVYGYENQVFLKEYPQNCCWGCALM
ncbi:hypothetical protein TCAL_13601 [Tigriopus californicus]|uniref:CR-type domain-containing protein n=1 Tax=Tigriopus californicus TaxID=6832 RepID=A0A553NEX7_TIGCA|nr:protein SSUH2 homolog [Tigriopus californicus]TRY63965.1 hypothetical protein TCAL_13601 [Tigriopus californicus]|eukprot:TCALIF_13601-PA protein Name:"Similar to SSUH2 Protein SSUH2 homolog (Homo sapiens)" AED:0.04 eAED:0.04 QI:0/-1/0/1/-1/1/1/0/393